MAALALFVLGLVMGSTTSPWWFLLCVAFIAITALNDYESAKAANEYL